MKNINLPFTVDKNIKNNKSFKIMNDIEINNKIKKGGSGLINSIKKIISNNNSNNNRNNIHYIKASESLKYKK